MTERYDLRDEHGRITGYVLRETPHHTTYFRSGPPTSQPDSPTVEAICKIVGLLMFAALGLLIWIMATAT